VRGRAWAVPVRSPGSATADPCYLGVKSVFGPSRRTNAAISFAALWTSFMLTTSLGECMYRFGIDTTPVGTPCRVR